MSLQGEPWSQTGRIPHARTKVVLKKEKKPRPPPLPPLLLLLFQPFSARKFSQLEEAEEP